MSLKKSNAPDVITFGCRLNIYESQVIKELTEKEDLKNIAVFNTCAVTKEAERQARQSIRKYKKKNPNTKVIVTGCAAQINPKKFMDLPEVDQVLGNIEKLDPKSYKGDKSLLVSDIMEAEELVTHMVASFEGKVRAFVQIQNGCNHRCTFCTIPYGRGNSRTAPLGQIQDQIQNLISEGYKEFVLTGVDITDYGLDLPGKPTLGQTIKRLFKLLPDLERLRLSSLDPSEIDDDLWDLIANEPRLLPHFHLSLQAGDDMILKRMKRRHLRHHIFEFLNKVRDSRPDAVIGADIIAGFPTETDAMFQNTWDIVKGLDLLHVFPYSAHENTPSSKMPQVPKTVIKERAAILREEGEFCLSRALDRFVGKTEKMLVEKNENGILYGRTDHYLSCEVDILASTYCPLPPIGSIIPVHIKSHTNKALQV